MAIFTPVSSTFGTCKFSTMPVGSAATIRDANAGGIDGALVIKPNEYIVVLLTKVVAVYDISLIDLHVVLLPSGTTVELEVV